MRHPDRRLLQDLPGSRQALQAANIPVVETWSSPICARDCVVAPDNDHAGRLAAQHLAARGHKRVACVSGSSSWDTERRQGFLTQARQLELEIAAEIVQHDVRGVPDGRTAMLKLLATQTIFDAVFCTNDQLTIGVVSKPTTENSSFPWIWRYWDAATPAPPSSPFPACPPSELTRSTWAGARVPC
ncbi:substrate-binding domain-containing protein [Achromobacter xylosoxidans]